MLKHCCFSWVCYQNCHVPSPLAFIIVALHRSFFWSKSVHFKIHISWSYLTNCCNQLDFFYSRAVQITLRLAFHSRFYFYDHSFKWWFLIGGNDWSANMLPKLLSSIIFTYWQLKRSWQSIDPVVHQLLKRLSYLKGLGKGKSALFPFLSGDPY